MPSDEALQSASQILGAVVLARLVQDDGLAERLLTVAIAAFKEAYQNEAAGPTSQVQALLGAALAAVIA